MNLPWQSDGPGFTDHPRTDIATHRSIARGTKRIGWLVFALGVAAAYLHSAPWYAGGGFAVWMLSALSSFGLRLQALEWEYELDVEGGDSGRGDPQ